MSAKPHVVFTLSDANCGDFLIRHWLRSMQENVDLSKIDIVVLDYGLSPEQRRQLQAQNVILTRCVVDQGILHNLCYREMARVLKESNYRQAVVFDAGDIIFQADFSHLFEENQDSFRAVCEDVDAAFHELIMKGTDFNPSKWEEVADYIRGKPSINGNTMMAPAEKYIYIWDCFEKWCHTYEEFGLNQAILNFVLYQEGFVRLSDKYNFVLGTAKEPFTIKDHAFYDSNGELIPIVHNAGGKEFWRRIKNFGYGSGHNQRKIVVPFLMRTFLASIRWGHKHYRQLVSRRRRANRQAAQKELTRVEN